MNSNYLVDRAMIAVQTISFWTASRHDGDASADVERQNGAQIGIGRYNKTLVAREALAKARAARSALEKFHRENTLPWKLRGCGLLPSRNFLEYKMKHAQLVTEFDREADAFCSRYSEHVEHQRSIAGTLFNAADYPSPKAIRSKFGVSLEFMAIPIGKDFRVQLHDEQLAEIMAERDRMTEQAIDDAQRDLWRRTHTAVSQMVASLRKFERDPETQKIVHTFRDSVTGNIRTLCDVLGRLNIRGDAELDRMRERLLAELCTDTPERLREDDHARGEAIRSADQILADMSAYVGDPVGFEREVT